MEQDIQGQAIAGLTRRQAVRILLAAGAGLTAACNGLPTPDQMVSLSPAPPRITLPTLRPDITHTDGSQVPVPTPEMVGDSVVVERMGASETAKTLLVLGWHATCLPAGYSWNGLPTELVSLLTTWLRSIDWDWDLASAEVFPACE